MSLSETSDISMRIPHFLSQTEIAEPLLTRFLAYAGQDSESNPEQADLGIQPSAETERAFAEKLAAELHGLGISDIQITGHAYVCARIPPAAGYEQVPSVCFLAHLDTASEVSGKNVRPQVFRNYDGAAITLNGGIVLDPATDTQLADSAGDTIITSDGTTLLGADDKAGIAAIMTAAEQILKNPQCTPHGQIEIIFSPDEETGHGMDNVPADWIQSSLCYTLDGGHIGEIESECFHAWKSVITFAGKAKHTGTARPDMVNAVTMAASFVAMLPQNESPEATDGRLGFYAPMSISGQIEQAEVTLFLRDFDIDGMNRRIAAVDAFAKATECRFPGSRVSATHTPQYANMKDVISRTPEVLDILVRAVAQTGIQPVFKPIRGGTDGSRLSEMGFPTPNIFTGGHNFHSRTEWASLAQMVCSVHTILNIITLLCQTDGSTAHEQGNKHE